VEPGEPVPVDKTLDNADPDDYDALILPGGTINADQLRVNRGAQRFLRNFFENDKLVAAICHGPWLLVSAGVIQDRQLTSYHTIQDDIRNAGGEWVDEEVVAENNLITSRKPDDLPAFNQAIIDYLAEE
jgi:protease I